MDIPEFNNPKFSEQTLKGFLLKHIEPNSTNPEVQELNHYQISRVDRFWESVIKPLEKEGKFDGNKIQWYFEIYKEGLEAHKSREHATSIPDEKVDEIVEKLRGLKITEFIELGTSFLSNSFALLTAWVREKLIVYRLKHIYHSDSPIDWIHRAEAEEEGAMKQTIEGAEEVQEVMRKIALIMHHRI